MSRRLGMLFQEPIHLEQNPNQSLYLLALTIAKFLRGDQIYHTNQPFEFLCQFTRDALEPLQNSRRDLESAIGGSIVDLVTRGEKRLEKSVASRSLEMENTKKQGNLANPLILQSEELYEYILATSVYPREPEPLKELRKATAPQPLAYFGTSPDVGQLIAMFLKIVNAKKTIEIGVFTGYSLLLPALTIPDDGKITAIDVDRTKYEIGLPIIQKSGVEHKINFIESRALPVLDELLQDPKNEGSFDFAFVDADKVNYWNYHERMTKLVKVGGIIIYDNTLWGGYVALPEEDVPEKKRAWRQSTIEFNNSISSDSRVEISHASVGDGVLICRRIC